MSIFNHQKDLSATKYSIREHHDQRTDDGNRAKTHVDDISVDEVHTVNNWENADLGDDQRKQKFLRLMGAKKHKDGSQTDTHIQLDQNHSPPVDRKHCRSTADTESINRDLEKQFNEGLQSTILHTHHEGFGFHGSYSDADQGSHQNRNANFVPATAAAMRLSTSEQTLTDKVPDQ